MDFSPQYHTMEHEAKCIEFRAEILGSVFTFLLHFFFICSCLIVCEIILGTFLFNFKLRAGTVWPAQLTLLSK